VIFAALGTMIVGWLIYDYRPMITARIKAVAS
jgi:hypothetical protein